MYAVDRYNSYDAGHAACRYGTGATVSQYDVERAPAHRFCVCVLCVRVCCAYCACVRACARARRARACTDAHAHTSTYGWSGWNTFFFRANVYVAVTELRRLLDLTVLVLAKKAFLFREKNCRRGWTDIDAHLRRTCMLHDTI